MGNQLTPQQIINNLHEFKPDLGLYQIFPNQNVEHDQSIKYWQHKFTSERLLDKSYLARTWAEFYQLLDSFAFRYNNEHIVSSKYLLVENEQITHMSNESAFRPTSIRIFYEDSLTNLSQFKQIPQQDGWYFLMNSLKGFELLLQKVKFPFEIREQMFHITSRKQLKVWLGGDVGESDFMGRIRQLKSEGEMIGQILGIVKQNVFFHHKLQQDRNDRTPTLKAAIEELVWRRFGSFGEVIKFMEDYLQRYEIRIPKEMGCLRELSNEEFIDFMQQSRFKAIAPSHKYATISTNETSGVTISSVKPFTPIDQFTNQQSSLVFQRNYSMGNLAQKNQSRIFDSANQSKCVNSRSKSNKKSGLSLVKDGKHNAQSQIVLRQSLPLRPNKNQHSGILVHSKEKPLPPRSSAKKVSFNLSQKKQNQNFLISTPSKQNSNKLQLSSHHSRGISVTKKQPSHEKLSMRLNPQSPFSRSNNHLNTQQSNTINYSTVSVGPLPIPQYRNDSKSRTAVMPNSVPINFTTSNYEKFVPNQSLTIFQNEMVPQNNVILPVKQIYEVPKICVHSPKAQGKIIRMDSMSTQQQSGQKPIVFQTFISNNINPTYKQDHIKQTQTLVENHYYSAPVEQKVIRFETPNKKESQFGSYIQENDKVFTDPRLYEYITNNKSEKIQNENKPTKVGESRECVNRKQEKKHTYIDYLANAHISESLDYKTADKLFALGSDKEIKSPQKIEVVSPNKFTLNDFPTIEEIEEPLPSSDEKEEENPSFLPVQLNFIPNVGSRKDLSSVRRGYEESMVVEYKKFYDDTNRSNNSPSKHYFSPLKKKPVLEVNNVEPNVMRKYGTVGGNWQPLPSRPQKVQFSNNLFPIQQNHQPTIMIAPPRSIEKGREKSLSPFSKMIYNGVRQPAINPLLLQDMERIRNNRAY